MTPVRSQDGAIAIMVAVLAMVMFATAAFALDGGRLWMAKRNLVTATDGSALAAASAYAVGDNGCDLYAELYKDLNAPLASQECNFEGDSEANTGYVTVVGGQSIDLIFGRFVGIPTATVESTTAVQVGFPVDAAGLRPLVLCEENEDIKRWDPGSNEVYHIPISKDDDGCGGAPGNVGWLVLDENRGANAVSRIIDTGHQQLITLPTTIPAHTGAISSFQSNFNDLVGETILIAVFSEPTGGPGASAGYEVVNFAAMKVVEAVLTGPEADRHLKVTAARLLTTGTCCGPAPDIDLGVRAMNICAIDVASAAANCTN